MDVRPFSQMDPRWKNQHLGLDDTVTLGSYGCLLTCLAMVADYYGYNETPATLNEKMRQVGGFQGALVIPAALPAALPGLRYLNFINCQNVPAPLAEIDACLAQRRPVIVEVDYAPKAGLQNHWIVLYDRPNGAADYLLRDPWPFPVQAAAETLLASRYRFAGSAAQIIQSVIFLDSAARPLVAGPLLDRGVRATFPIYAAADGLALRSQTLVAAETLIKRVALGARLAALESDADTRAKLGVLNQWLAVLDPADGVQGYAAAWYLADSPPDPRAAEGSVPAAVSTPGAAAAGDGSLVLRTTTDGVALRTRPAAADDSLAGRAPVNSELLCLDPPDAAAARVGVAGQWLPVRDVTGCDYFVSAAYVSPTGEAALGPRGRPTTRAGQAAPAPGAPVIVRAAVEDLALRSQPVIVPESLIKRLPVNSELLVLDPIEPDQVGRMGEWLHVQDITGASGWVAAWYVIMRPSLGARAAAG